MGKTLGYGEITVANMTEPFTVMLTNEAQQFATDSNRKVTSAQSYYTDIIVIRGSQERTDYTIGNITSGSGITVSKTSKRVTFSVSAGSVIGADTGIIEIPITLDGQTVKKQFSWSCGKQGPQGVKGTDGNSFAWNMLSETNCGKKHWGTVSSGGKYSVESETTEDNIEAVKLICTESVSSSEWSYTCFTDLEMLKQLKPSTKYTLSYDIKANRSGMISHTICRGDISNSCTNTVVVSNIIGDETWQHISVVLTTNDLKITPTNEVVYLGRTALSKVGYSIIKNLKLTEGYIDTPWSPSQSDIEGKGIAQIVQYYLATSQATGVTSSTSGWSTDITTQKITATKKYLWNCSQTRYTDGTSEPITTPTIIGAYGDKGETGADGQDGAGFHWNLLKYSGDLSKQVLGGAGTYTATVESIEDKTTPSGQAEKITYTVQGTGGKFIQTGKYIKEGNIKQGKTYTVSVWCKCSSIKSTGVINAEFLDNKTYVNPTLSTEWQQYVVTGVANKDVTSTSSASAISFYYNDNMSVGDIFYISSPKVEEGDKASPWCTTYEETLAKNLTITPSAQIFKSTDGGNTFAPNQITITPTLQGDITFGKWQYSIDGGVSFADVVSGQSGLSVDTNKNLTIAKTSGLFTDKVTMVTFRAVASDSSFYDTCSIAKLYDVSDIGDGRNLLWNSNFAKTDEAINTSTYTTWGLILRGNTYTATIDTSVKHNNFNTLKVIGTKAGENGGQDLIYRIKGLNLDEIKFTETGVKYTLSFYAKASIACNFSARYAYDSYAKDTNVALSTDWKRYEIQMHPTTTSYQTSLIFKMDAASTVWFSEFKLEKGSSATGYSTAPEDVQTAILSTKNSIENVSSKVDTNTKSIQDKVSKTTYERELTLVKGDLSKANEGLNKWRYEIYPKSLFESEDQGKSTIDIFAKNLNLVPTQTVLLDDASLSTGMNYGDNHIAYALTFVKMSTKKDVTTKMFNDDGASLYVNGKLIGSYGIENTSGHDVTFTLARGWNCIEVVVNEEGGLEGFRFSTTLSKLSECQMMNCYYGTPVARQSRITNQLVDVTKNLTGVTSTVQDVMTAVGNSGNITEFKNNYSKWKQNVDGIESRVGSTYVTNEKFDGLEIGGRNLLTKDDCIMSKWQNLYPAHCKITSNDYSNHVDYVPTDGQWEIVYKKISVTKGQKYILSFDYKINKAYNYLSGQKYGVYLSTSVPTNAAPANIITNGQYVIENTVTNTKRGMIAFTAPTDTLYIVINGGCIDDNQTGLSFEFNKWKLEKGNKATDWTPAPEDVNGKIQSVETIATQTADKFSWLVKSGTSSSNFELTDKTATLVAEKINLNGLVTFSGLNTDTQNKINSAVNWVNTNGTNTNNMYSMVSKWTDGAISDTTQMNGGWIKTNTITANKIAIGDFTNYSQLDKSSASIWGFDVTNDSSGMWFIAKSPNRDIFVSKPYPCQGGESYLIEYDISTNLKGSQNSSDTANYIDSAIGVYGYTGDIDNNGLPTKATNIWYAKRVTGSSDAPITHVQSTVTISDITKQIRIFLQTNAFYNFKGTIKIRNLSVRKMTTGNLIVDGSITADKIATDAIKSRNYISSSGTQGSFLNLSDGSFTSPNLSWDSNGNLIAKNANLSGEVTATKGTIGGWNIKDSLYSNVREPYDINKYYAKKILNKPSFTNIYMSTNVLSAANYGTVGGDHVTVGDSLIATNTAYSFGVNISLGRISLFGSTYYTSDLASELNKSSSLSLSGDKISFWEYDEDGHEISEQNNTYITSNYARFSGDIFIGGDIGTDGGADIGGKLQASSIATKNGGLIETAGTIYGGGEIQCGGGQMRIIGGDYGILLRNDGSDFYILSTDSGNQWGYWNSKRPFRINLANGIPYFEYGIIIPNENYLLGNGYQMCRGTSWGGVCIGDDSKGLRFYGTSIWASHSISTSDENLKENFTTLDQYEDFYMNLNPIGFNYIGDYDGKKTHFGFGAHKTEDVLESEGYDSDKFAVVTHRPLVQEDIEKRFGKNIDVDIETEYGVSYTEFIALNTHMIQKTRKELEIVKQEKENLEARLQAIEAKLGL